MYKLIREVPVEDAYDVVVAGGGAAGSAAAICAARSGARTLLIEETGCLGGLGTSGLVCAFDPMANGRELVRGLMREVVEALHQEGFLGPGVTPDWWLQRFAWTPFHPEGYKLVLDRLATEAGVEVRFFTRVIDAEVAAAERVV